MPARSHHFVRSLESFGLCQLLFFRHVSLFDQVITSSVFTEKLDKLCNDLRESLGCSHFRIEHHPQSRDALRGIRQFCQQDGMSGLYELKGLDAVLKSN